MEIIDDFGFVVIDKLTEREADMEQIAIKEEWARGLIYCDMEQFCLGEDGTLYLLDECGAFRYCPSGRFEVNFRGLASRHFAIGSDDAPVVKELNRLYQATQKKE